jgi:hypothetical protein
VTEFVSPFQHLPFRAIQARVVQGNAAGLLDQVILTVRQGRRSVSDVFFV